jgi:hypothetical protein
MLPSIDEVDAAYAFLARRYGFERSLHIEGVRAALALAHQHALAADDEPAALFFGLTRYAKSLGQAPRLLPALLAQQQCSRIGVRLDGNIEDLSALFVPVVSNRMTFAEVRAWFAQRSERA